MTETRKGLIVKAQSGFYVVRNEAGVITCRLRGKLKKKRPEEDVAAVGDWVTYSVNEDGSGSIETVEPRKKALARQISGVKFSYRQIILANPDQVMLVFACTHPDPSLRLIDRFLVILEKQGIRAVIVVNKVDLLGLEAARKMFSIYETLGYKVIYTSTRDAIGIEAVKQELIGKISAFVGPSGVGKSSLLNAIQPNLGLSIRAVSGESGKGKHTTQVRELFPLAEGGFVADTPGLRSLALWDIEPEELDGYFVEMAPLVSQCQFNDCSHQHEPGCAIIAAVASGKISSERYTSYLRLRFGDALTWDEDESDDDFSDY